MRRLLLAAVPLALVAGVALPSTAQGLAPQIVDPSGDEVFPDAGLDIVSVGWDTSGTTTKKKVGKKMVSVYTPDTLLITLKAAGPIETKPGTAYWVSFDAPCGNLALQYANSAVISDWVESSCADIPSGNWSDVGEVVVNADTITFSTSLKGKPALKVGDTLSGFHAYTDEEDPVVAGYGPGFLGGDQFSEDSASSDKSWKIG